MILQGCCLIAFLQNTLNSYAQHDWVSEWRITWWTRFLQGDVEKEQGLPVGPVMDHHSQKGK